MGYDYNSRVKLSKNFIENWKKENEKKIAGLSEKEKQAYKAMFEGYYDSYDFAYKYEKECLNRTDISGFIKENFSTLVELLVPEELQASYYYAIDKYNKFTYSMNYYRRSVRAKSYAPYLGNVFRLMHTCFAFKFYGAGLIDYIKNNLSEELLDYKLNGSGYMGISIRMLDDLVFAGIDKGDSELIAAIKEMFTAENNNLVVTREIIRGVVKSDNEELNDLLSGFLVAARLQEGVRQVICENADCGTIAAFKKIAYTIRDNNMLRFAAVKRAVGTWTGVGAEQEQDRSAEKVLADIITCLEDENNAYALINTEDAINICVGLWGLGFYEITTAMEEVKRLVVEGTRQQKLAASYYINSLEYKEYKNKIANYVVEHIDGDVELLCAYMHIYMDSVGSELAAIILNLNKENNLNQDSYIRNQRIIEKSTKERLYTFFENKEQAEKHYEILKDVAEKIKKKITFSPFIFPWYSASLEKNDVLSRMLFIACVLEDEEKQEELVEKIEDFSDEYGTRNRAVKILLIDAKTQKRKNMLLKCLSNRSTDTRKVAAVLVKRLAENNKLNDEDYKKIEACLKYKLGDLRANAIEILNDQQEEKRHASILRLLKSKDKMIRLGGLDMLLKAKGKNEKIDELIEAARGIENPESEESVLIDQLSENSGKKAKEDNGKKYGLYNEAVEIMPEEAEGKKKGLLSQEKEILGIKQKNNLDYIKPVKEYFELTRKRADEILKALEEFIDKNAKAEYKTGDGEEHLLGEISPEYRLRSLSYKNELKAYERYPLPELWREFKEKNIKEFREVNTLRILTKRVYNAYKGLDETKVLESKKHIKELLGDTEDEYVFKYNKYGIDNINTIMHILCSFFEEEYKAPIPDEVKFGVIKYIVEEVPDEIMLLNAAKKREESYYGAYYDLVRFISEKRISEVLSEIKELSDDESFKKFFYLRYALDEKMKRSVSEKENEYYYSYNRNYIQLRTLDYVKAYSLGIISKEMVYKVIIEKIGLSDGINELGALKKKKRRYSFAGIKEELMDEAFNAAANEIYLELIEVMLDTELKRGDTPTEFSEACLKISVVYGIENLIDILKALGDSTLDRSTYYYGSNKNSKRVVLSHLLNVSQPDEGDTVEKLEEAVKKNKIKETRLIEVAMFAPEWMDMIEKVLKLEGFKSGCYYFMAHMDDYFDDKKMAIIAKYTPLSSGELNAGCFDLKWFTQVYETLGEKVFDKLYKSAKYISDGSKHSRARKYADAALGRVTVEELEKEIDAKRNKDLLMSLGLVPIKGTKDLLGRYEYMQKYLKESKQFGAQRRASEGAAVETALKNMSTCAGYSDELRLTLSMETELAKQNKSLFEENEIDEYSVKIEVDDSGKADLIISKAGKSLKTIPAAIKKNEKFIEIKEFKDKLKRQYSRSVAMFEKSMEDREIYGYEELKALCANPVLSSIITKLVFVSEKTGAAGMLKAGENEKLPAEFLLDEKEEKIRIAHPYDLYKEGSWTKYQKLFFEKAKDGEKQPFKQVFRELYVKLDEELDKNKSLMFAGNQIQVGKTLGCLKGRRWVADYEDGLQKIYYADNIIAQIYAVADWFSPADAEPPVLEWVVFSDRKTGKFLKMSEIPDILYSEVMRDVDLAVSVAHAGGVDPQTSHSTIEMRRVVLEFNLELFGIKNVSFEKNHALIKGKYGDYTVHLGSGVIHKMAGPQINIVMVQGGKRSKIFLPYIDEDPKTAEIMTKVITLAEDHKIKDPEIMRQIMG